MKKVHILGVSIVLVCSVCILIDQKYKASIQHIPFFLQNILSLQKQLVIPIATQTCGNRNDEIVTMLKSILLETKAHIKLYLFVDVENKKRMNDTLLALTKTYPDNLSFTLLSISYPGVNGRNHFAEKTKPCSTLRVFFPRLLPELDALIYLDTDTIFFRPIEDLWLKLFEFNSTQVFAIAPESPFVANWYSRQAKHPHYGIYGLNTGVMIMHLARLRKLNYTDAILDLFNKWQTKIMWGEQDLHNIWLHFHPEKLYYLPCTWNYRDTHCKRGNGCGSAEKEGPYVLHGNAQNFVKKDLEPGFYAVNKAFEEYSLGQNAKENVLRAMKKYLMGVTKDAGKCTSELLRLFRQKF